MLFNSHVAIVLQAAVLLVNNTTPGHVGTDRVTPLSGDPLRRAVRDSIAREDYEPRVSHETAGALAAIALEVREVFEATARGDIDQAAAQVNRMLGETGARPQLDFTDGGGWNLHFHGPDDSVAHGWAAGLAAGLALALGSDLAGRLGLCSADPCDRVYVDTSRNGGKRFCSARCQSRVKAAAHRARGQ